MMKTREPILGDIYDTVSEKELALLEKENSRLYSTGERQAGIVYISKPLSEEKIRAGVEKFLLDQDQLFLSPGFELDIFTQPITSPIERNAIRAVCESSGFSVLGFTEYKQQMEYLCSEGWGGHYSTDFYRYLVFGVVTIISA